MGKLQGNTHLIAEGWNLYKKYWKEIYLAIAIAILAFFIIIALMMSIIGSSALLGNNWVFIPVMGLGIVILYVLMFAVVFGVQVGLTKIALDAASDQKPNLRDMYRHYRKIPSYMLTNYLTTFITYIGLFLLIIPGFILFARYQLAGVFVVDRGVGFAEALSLSDKATKGNIWGVIKFDIFLFLINLLAYLPLLIMLLLGIDNALLLLGYLGFIITVPLTLVSFVVMYKKLSVGV